MAIRAPDGPNKCTCIFSLKENFKSAISGRKISIGITVFAIHSLVCFVIILFFSAVPTSWCKSNVLINRDDLTVDVIIKHQETANTEL